jgi:hypothetical protein
MRENRENCVVCGLDGTKVISSDLFGLYGYSCKRCGDYNLTNQMRVILPNYLYTPQSVAVLSHWIRTEWEVMSRDEIGNKKIVLTQDLVEKVLKNPLPTPAKQADNFIRWMGGKAHGEPIDIQPGDEIPILSIIGSATSQEFQIVLEYCSVENLNWHA